MQVDIAKNRRVHCVPMTTFQAIDNHNVMALIDQLKNGMGTNVSGAAGNDNSRHNRLY